MTTARMNRTAPASSARPAAASSVPVDGASMGEGGSAGLCLLRTLSLLSDNPDYIRTHRTHLNIRNLQALFLVDFSVQFFYSILFYLLSDNPDHIRTHLNTRNLQAIFFSFLCTVFRAGFCEVMLCVLVLCYIMLCYSLLFNVLLYYVMLCYVMSSNSVLGGEVS